MAKKISRKTTDIRRDILQSSEKLFAEHGFQRTSIRMIARLSKCNCAMIYYYFKSKEGLYGEIFKSQFLRSQPAIGIIERSGASCKEKLNLFLSFLSSKNNNSSFKKLILREIILGEVPCMKKIIKEHVQKNINWLIGIISSGMESGEFRKLDPGFLAHSIFSLLTMNFRNDSFFEGSLQSEKNCDLSKHYSVEDTINSFLSLLKN